jgi:2-methylisocitrate lyase-like PEP mutase family enzyme
MVKHSTKENTVMVSQADKAHAFQAMHTNPGTFVIPNPWDVGSAKILVGLGYKALATTSAGMAWHGMAWHGAWVRWTLK